MDVEFVVGLTRRGATPKAVVSPSIKSSLADTVNAIYAEFIRRMRATGLLPSEALARHDKLRLAGLSGKDIERKVIEELSTLMEIRNDARSELCARLEGYGLRQRVMLDRSTVFCKRLVDDGLKILKGEVE